jgi:hypothetical protein
MPEPIVDRELDPAAPDLATLVALGRPYGLSVDLPAS